MNYCDFCKKEAKYSFICPQCGNRFCNEHRKPEYHDCQTSRPLKYSAEEKTSPPVLDTSNIDHVPENEVDEYYNLEEIIFTEKNVQPSPSNGTKARALVAQLSTVKTPLTVLIIISLLSGALMGTLIFPNENADNLQQRYDALSEYYTELQANNQDLNLLVENMTLQINSLQTELDKLNQDYSALQNDWDSLFSDQTQYETPSINQLINWLAADSTDQHTISGIYIRARARSYWRLA